MANQKYIKVTLKGETKSYIVLATLKPFYISQGAKIEHPTDEEVYAAVPQERPAVARPANRVQSLTNAAEAAAEAARDAEEIAELKKENAELQKDLQREKAVNEEGLKNISIQSATIAELRDKLAAAETTITESEQLIESLRKELAEATAKPQKKAKAEVDEGTLPAAEA